MQLYVVAVPVFTICSNQKWLMNWVSKSPESATSADLIASASPGCTLQITKHLQMQGKIKVIHPMGCWLLNSLGSSQS